MDINQINTLLGKPDAETERIVDEVVKSSILRIVASMAPPGSKVPFPEVVYDLKGHTAGMANSHRIRLNLSLLNDPRYREDMLKQTIPHEAAHVVVSQLWPKEPGHGAKWQRAMYALGLNPTRCHQYETKAARNRKRMSRPYVYKCACREHHATQIIHRRIQQEGQVRTCRICGTAITKYDLVRVEE